MPNTIFKNQKFDENIANTKIITLSTTTYSSVDGSDNQCIHHVRSFNFAFDTNTADIHVEKLYTPFINNIINEWNKANKQFVCYNFKENIETLEIDNTADYFEKLINNNDYRRYYGKCL